MLLKLNVYTDETMSEIKRTVETDELKVPYRVSMFILANLDKFEENEDDKLLSFIGENTEKLDKIIKATFGITESELECINAIEIINTIKALYTWTMAKVNGLGGDEKNVLTPVKE